MYTLDIPAMATKVQQELVEVENRRLKLLGQLELLARIEQDLIASQQETAHADHSAPDPEPAAQSDQPAEQSEEPTTEPA